MLDLVVRRALFDLVAGEKKTPLVFIVRQPVRAPDEHLLHARQSRCGLLAEHVDIDRHLAPAEEEEPALRDHFLDRRLGARLRVGVVVREENLPHREVALVKELVAELLDDRLENLVGDLGRNARAVARLHVRIHRAAMGQIAQRLERVFQHLVRALSTDLRDETDAAGVVFKVRRIQRRMTSGAVESDLVEHSVVAVKIPGRSK